MIIDPTILLYSLKEDRLKITFYAYTKAETGRDFIKVFVKVLTRLAKSIILSIGTDLLK